MHAWRLHAPSVSECRGVVCFRFSSDMSWCVVASCLVSAAACFSSGTPLASYASIRQRTSAYVSDRIEWLRYASSNCLFERMCFIHTYIGTHIRRKPVGAPVCHSQCTCIHVCQRNTRANLSAAVCLSVSLSVRVCVCVCVCVCVSVVCVC